MATNGRGGAGEGETDFIAVVVKCADLIQVKYSACGLLFGGLGANASRSVIVRRLYLHATR